MKNALIIHHSKTGTTRQFGNEIKLYCLGKGINANIIPIEEYKKEDLDGIDYLFLGSWTQGLVFFAQHPDKLWKQFAQSILIPKKCKVILFTTYKVLTGSMFTKMKKYLGTYIQNVILEIKSRNGFLFSDIEELLDNHILTNN
ncbi:MAG: hypothetical protein JEY96_02445 [Bacteroidales bacterium]|nr:hypothetical protein [Bacteroidales bacterium]